MSVEGGTEGTLKKLSNKARLHAKEGQDESWPLSSFYCVTVMERFRLCGVEPLPELADTVI